MRYQVQHRYQGGGLGPWAPGQEVDLDPPVAAWVNRDSPGTLAEVEQPPDPAWKPERDRMVKRAASRGQGGPQSKIGKDTFKAVKQKGD